MNFSIFQILMKFKLILHFVCTTIIEQFKLNSEKLCAFKSVPFREHLFIYQTKKNKKRAE